MTTIDPTALLAWCDEADRHPTDGLTFTTPKVRALVAAYVEGDALRADVAEAVGYASEQIERAEKAEAEVTALRAAVARMTGAEAEAAVRVDLRGLPVVWHNDVLPLAAVLSDDNVTDLAAAAVRAIAALGDAT